MENETVTCDERTTAVTNASYRWAYYLLSFGLLLSVAYRGLVLRESSWDLLALVTASGFIATYYQGMNKILTRRWAVIAITAFVIGAVVAASLVLFR